METKIKVVIEFTVGGQSLEDALAEYDELTVSGMLTQVLDKAVGLRQHQYPSFGRP